MTFSEGTEKFKLFFILFCVMALSITFGNKPFFWDKDILDSIQAHWFLNSNFNLVLPDDIDPGHPPFVSLLLALAWKFFGKTLFVSHMVMLPFSLGLVIQTYYLLKNIKLSLPVLSLIVVLIDTSILTQMVVVSSDLILLFFFVLSINAILNSNRKILIVGSLFLSIINLRAPFALFGLFLFDVILHKKKSAKEIAFACSSYIPGLIFFASFIFFHYSAKGWVGYHENSPWAQCYDRVGLENMLKNFFIICWRFFDFGRIIYLVLLILLLAGFLRRRLIFNKNVKIILLLFSISLALNLPIMIISKNLLSHRYIVPCTYLLSILVVLLIDNFYTKKVILYLCIITSLILGNFWIYPNKIAMGWDATLAHIPYHTLHKRMINYIDENKIAVKDIGSSTPNLAKLKYIYLNNDDRAFKEQNLETDSYILYSNIYNNFTDEEIDILESKWIILKQDKIVGAEMILYKRPLGFLP